MLFRLSQLRVKLLHLDTDLLDIKIGGLESDCVYKANERMILKGFLNSFSIDDMSDMTLYSKVSYTNIILMNIENLLIISCKPFPACMGR